ncbi:hypothetical protein T07_10424, partial [Trichinella nelsoni]
MIFHMSHTCQIKILNKCTFHKDANQLWLPQQLVQKCDKELRFTIVAESFVFISLLDVCFNQFCKRTFPRKQFIVRADFRDGSMVQNNYLINIFQITQP